jgi:hypothetical protein
LTAIHRKTIDEVYEEGVYMVTNFYLAGPLARTMENPDEFLYQRAMGYAGSINALAKHMGVERDTVYGWLIGKVPKKPNLEKLRKYVADNEAREFS